MEPYADEDVVGLGAGFPSFGDYERGILDSELSGFPSMHGFALRQYLEDEYGVPARLVADPNLLAFGILRFGEGREHPTFGAIGLGTGTAIGIVRGGQVLTGPKGFPDPVMRFYTVWGWPPAWGHSGFHFADHYGADAKTVAGRALAGNDDAFVTWNSVGAALAKTLVRLASDADVDLFVIAGGLANAYELFEPSLKSGTSDHGITVMKTDPQQARAPGRGCPVHGLTTWRSERGLRRRPNSIAGGWAGPNRYRPHGGADSPLCAAHADTRPIGRLCENTNRRDTHVRS